MTFCLGMCILLLVLFEGMLVLEEILAPAGDPLSPSSLVGVAQDSEDSDGQGDGVDETVGGDILEARAFLKSSQDQSR
jgi:hypothetical protein